MRHLIDPTDLTVAETEQIVALAEDIIANRAKYSEACRGKKLATVSPFDTDEELASEKPMTCPPSSSIAAVKLNRVRVEGS